MNALSVRDLTKIYPQFTLDKISFCAKEGHIVGLIGRNGAGKSTVIKGILRLISASGEIKIFGRDASRHECEVKQIVGYAGGGFRYYPFKTLFRVRKAYARFYPLWDQVKYENYLLRFGISEKKRVRDLSEGMKVKFSVALALSHGAKLLVMDEPTSGLDPLSREEFCDILLNLVREERITVLFSTHITSDLLRTADDIVYLSRGKMLANAPLRELLSSYSLAHFSSADQALKTKVIGLKPVKDGFEGLIPRKEPVPDDVSVTDADIDSIMIHLERENCRAESD